MADTEQEEGYGAEYRTPVKRTEYIAPEPEEKKKGAAAQFIEDRYNNSIAKNLIIEPIKNAVKASKERTAADKATMVDDGQGGQISLYDKKQQQRAALEAEERERERENRETPEERAARAAAAAEAERKRIEAQKAAELEKQRKAEEARIKAEQEERAKREQMIADTEDTLKRAGDYATGAAASTAESTSTQAIRKAIQAARTSKINRGQAALMGSQIAGDVYGQTYTQQLGEEKNRYLGTAQNREQVELQKKQLEQQAAQLDLEIKRLQQEGKYAEAAQKQQEKDRILNTIGKVAGFVGSLFLSDEQFKENIKEDNSLGKVVESVGAKPTLDSILRKIKPVNYNYKGESEKQVGIIAQDLEKTPLAGAVIDTPQGKVVDGGQLEGANLALIIELAAMVKDLQRKVGGK